MKTLAVRSTDTEETYIKRAREYYQSSKKRRSEPVPALSIRLYDVTIIKGYKYSEPVSLEYMDVQVSKLFKRSYSPSPFNNGLRIYAQNVVYEVANMTESQIEAAITKALKLKV